MKEQVKSFQKGEGKDLGVLKGAKSDCKVMTIRLFIENSDHFE